MPQSAQSKELSYSMDEEGYQIYLSIYIYISIFQTFISITTKLFQQSLSSNQNKTGIVHASQKHSDKN